MNIINYLIENKEFLFSGIGVSLLGFIIPFILKKLQKKKQKTDIDNSESHNIPFTNNIKAEKVNFNQTIISHSKTGDIHSDSTSSPVMVKTNNPELLKIKDKYFNDKNELRVFLFEKLAEARNTKLQLEVRHITDAAEDEIQIKHDKAVSEIEKLEEEGIIRFEKERQEVLSPYTRIKLTEKYFAAIE
ncbi:MAG: hypothetical protein AB7G44_02735 [Bacteroidia bacterium]